MKKRLVGLAVFATALAAPLFAVEVKELNLLTDSKFEPVEMHGRTTAAFGWAMSDNPRRGAGGLHGKYLSGEGLFDLEVKDGIMTLKYPEKLHPVYKKGGDVKFGNVRPYFGFEGGNYHIRAKVKVERGRFAFSDGHVVKPSPDWQDIDYISDHRVSGFTYRPVENGGFSITDFTVCPEYPELGGEINLPDGGKLNCILLSKDADHMMRFAIASWQHWLYKLTGVALPIKVVDKVEPTKGALAIVNGETAPGGWQLKVDKDGIVATCAEDAVYIPAIFDYLRELGYTHYSNRQPALKITPDPAYVLKAVDKKIVPHFRYFVYGIDGVGNNDRNMLYTKNTVDYFHLPKATMDHVLNVALPSEIYYKDHPEYYAVNEHGKRTIASYIIRTSPCFANKEAFEIAANNMVKYALSQPRRPHLLFYIGDGGHSCLCDECAKVNRGIKGNYSQMMMRFYNRLAKELQTKAPGMRVAFGAYADAQEPPLGYKPEPNLFCTYAVSHKRGFRCTLHHECEINKPGFDEIRAWSKFIGRDKLGPMTYRDMRPLHSVGRFKEYNKYMSYEIFSWIWMGWCPANPFVWTRWNYGEDDVVGLLKEFDDHYYGKAGKYVTEIFLMLEDFADNYKHTPEEIAFVRDNPRPIHIGLRCGDLSTKTKIDRKMFDKIYELLDKGLAEIGDSDEYARQNTLHEKAYYIFEDLNRYRLSDCRDDEELAKYAMRVAELARIAREVPTVRKKLIPMNSTQELFTLFSGVSIAPSKKEWCFAPEVDAFLKDPVKALAMKPENIPGGLLFPPRLMKGGVGTTRYDYQCPPRVANFVHRASSGRGEITINFKLAKAIPETTVLSLTGLDDDKPGVTRFAVEVNGKRVFEGANTFPEHEWGAMAIQVPGGTFQEGINIIKFINTTHEDSGTYNVTEDYTQGWVGFAEATLLNPNGDFKEFLKGSKKCNWYQGRQGFHQPLGNVEVKDGKLLLEGKGAVHTGAAFFRLHRNPKIACSPWKKVKVNVTASGEGKLLVVFWPYGDKGYLGKPAMAKMSKSFKLGAEPKNYECTIDIPAKALRIVPEIAVGGTDKATIEAFNMEFVEEAFERK
jgi:hypothetical protein